MQHFEGENTKISPQTTFLDTGLVDFLTEEHFVQCLYHDVDGWWLNVDAW